MKIHFAEMIFQRILQRSSFTNSRLNHCVLKCANGLFAFTCLVSRKTFSFKAALISVLLTAGALKIKVTMQLFTAAVNRYRYIVLRLEST